MAKKRRSSLTSFTDLAGDEELTFNEKEENKEEHQNEDNKEQKKPEQEPDKSKENIDIETEKNSSPNKKEIEPSEEETEEKSEQQKISVGQNEKPKLNNEETSNTNELLQSIFEQKKKRDSKKLIGIYFDGDVAKVLDKIGKNGGRGAKSQIVNDVIREFFKKNDLL